MPKIRLSKRLAVWTTAVAGTLGSAAGAYTIVGNPWGSEGPAAAAPSESSGESPANQVQPIQPVPIPDEMFPPDAERDFALDSPASRRPPMFMDPAVARSSHAEAADRAGGRRGNGYDPQVVQAVADVAGPEPAPAFDLASGPAAPGVALPTFQPPPGPEMQSAWAPNPPQDAPPEPDQSSISLAPPAMEQPPADPTSDEPRPALALGQAARSAIADAGSEPPAEPSLYSNAASSPLSPLAPASIAQEAGPRFDDHDEPGRLASSGRTASLAPPAAPAVPADDISAPAAFPKSEPARPAAGPTASALSGEGDGVPGADALNGPQSPALAIEKLAPPEIQVGKEATFQIHVRNVGQVAAHDVTILDRLPKGTQFVTATPAPAQADQGQLIWNVGTLQPGEQTNVSMQLMPLSEGEIGSVARVVFQAHASVRTLCTKPELSVTHTGPQKVLIGEAVMFDITVSNPGSGVATGVVLEEDVPSGLTHAAGRELEFEIGTLRPNETRQLQLTLKADKPGLVRNEILVRGDANLIARHAVELEVIAPALEVALDGPRMRYLDRPATYDVVISNPGTAPAREIELVTYLPRGMKFVSADHKGQYEPQNHAVYWSLEELPAQQTGAAKLTVLPLQPGTQKLKLEGRAELGLQQSFEQVVQVESVAELQFTVSDEADPIEVGAETSYLITLTNSGSSAATNVQLGIRFAPELKPLGGDGPTRIAIQGDQVQIDPLARIGPGEQAVYRIRVKGLAAGHQRVQIQLVTAEMPVPITREEVTRVYEDR